jgi:hypothetical protein
MYQKLLPVLALAAVSASAQAVTPYTLDVTTFYSFTPPTTPNSLNLGSFNNDTGYFIVTNDGASTFTGTVGDVAVANGGGDYSFTSGALTLNPGQSVFFAVNNESSNYGGFNGTNGAELLIKGFINGTSAVDLSVFDKDIHSGAIRTPFDLPSDSYVVQGGDPIGRDTGDGFETSQAPGHFTFQAFSAVPEPQEWAMLLLGAPLLGFAAKRKKA